MNTNEAPPLESKEKEALPSIEVKNLSKSYGDKLVLNDVSFTVKRGETLAVIGPSGTGKSTLLRILSGLEEPDSGQVIIREEKLGMVFQYSALLNSYTIGENIGFALHDNDTTDEEKKRSVLEKLDIVGLEGYYDSMPDELSGGQQKRASFARAVVNEPEIIFYDEPTAGLDPITSTIIEDYMIKLSGWKHTAGIVVTHQHSTIRRTANRILCLFKGNIVWQGEVQLLETDENPFIRQFMDGKTTGPFTD